MRLIDADELKKALAEMWYENNIRITGLSVAELIDDAPTIEPSKSAEQNVADVPSGDLVSREEYNKLLNDSIWESEHIGKMFEYQAEPSGDLISREEALDVVCKELQFQEENRNEPYDNGACFGLKTARELLLALPSADRPKGRKILDTTA